MQEYPFMMTTDQRTYGTGIMYINNKWQPCPKQQIITRKDLSSLLLFSIFNKLSTWESVKSFPMDKNEIFNILACEITLQFRPNFLVQLCP